MLVSQLFLFSFGAFSMGFSLRLGCWSPLSGYHPGPIFTPPVFTNLLCICKDHVGANSFFCPVIYMLKVPDRVSES